jgi:cyclopropane-fatty-acyl-phospholipid synthase
MRKAAAKDFVTQLLRTAGIIVNGSHPWDIQVHNENFYQRVLRDSDFGLGESYVEGWWDCPRIDMMVERLFEAESENYIHAHKRFYLKYLFAKFINYQTKSRALEVARVHYDLGNILYEAMLGPTISYSSGYWPKATTLDAAQLAKFELTCQKLRLEPGMRVLDIGCGWGTFARYAAEKYDVNVVGITLSKQQLQFAKTYCLNLPIEIRFQSYQDINEVYDRIVSLGTFEHVGFLNYRKYMQIIHKHLTRDGIFLLQTIGGNQSNVAGNEWLSKYIFPDTMIPSISQLGHAMEGLLIMEDWQNFGLNYDKTLMAWHKNFSEHWDNIKVYYDDRFYRIWNYYLLACAGGARARALQVWQIVLSRSGIKEEYAVIR